MTMYLGKGPSLHSVRVPYMGGLGCHKERVCQVVLSRVRTCSPFQEGILHWWIGELVVHPLGRG